MTTTVMGRVDLEADTPLVQETMQRLEATHARSDERFTKDRPITPANRAPRGNGELDVRAVRDALRRLDHVLGW